MSTAMTMSNSMRSCFKRCPKKFQYRYVEHLSPKVSGPALVLGSIVHSALETLYSPKNIDVPSGDMPALVMGNYDNEVASKANEILAAGGNMERFESDSYMGRQMLKYYLEEVWPHDDFKVVESEMKFDVRLKTPNGSPSHTRFIGYVDALVEKNGRLYLMEHKTAKDLNVSHLITDSQVTDYIWAMRELEFPVEGVYYNILRKIDPFSSRSKPPYHYREVVYRSDKEIEMCPVMLYAESVAIRTLPAYYRNPTRDCSWDCDFRQLCIAEMDGSDVEGIIEMSFERKERGR